jgi:nitrite reductase/ring-hydroxylating ferredoxin subunit
MGKFAFMYHAIRKWLRLMSGSQEREGIDMLAYVPVTKTSEIPKGRGKTFTVKGKRIAIFNDGENFYALDNACAHALGPLGRGRVKNGLVTCPVHDYAYDVKTGVCQTDPRLRVRSYEVLVEGEQIKVKC